MKLSEIIVNILAKKQKKPASAIYTKYGPALEAADEAHDPLIGKLNSDHKGDIHKLEAFIEEQSIALRSMDRQLNEFRAMVPSAVGAEGECKPTHAEEPTSFSQPTKFASPSDRTEFVAILQCDLEASRERMKLLWEEKESADRSFQQRIDHESQQIDLLEARIHLTHSTPAGNETRGITNLASHFVKGGL